MSLKDVDLLNAFRRLADKRIEDAMMEGKFDNLRGSGEPLPDEPIPVDENARATWWALHILKSNGFTPDEVRWRKLISTMKSELYLAQDESRVRRLVKDINELVYKLNTMGTNVLKSDIVGVDLDEELTRLRQERS